MKIALTGASGLIGSALISFLGRRGYDVWQLVRSKELAYDGAIYWNPYLGEIDTHALEGFDAFIHLAGENVGTGRWSEHKKAEIRDSRVEGTRLLVEVMSRLKSPPRVFLCASTANIYGDRGNELLAESSAVGDGFLADVFREV